MRTLLAAAFLFAAAALPAHAERKVCHVSRTLDAVRSEVGAVLKPEFDRLLVETGPIYAPLKMSSSTSWRPVSDAQKAASFYLYWYGDQIAGKSWRDPGGVAFKLGGFGLQWPNVDAPATQRLREIRTVVRLGEAKSDRRFELKTAGFTVYSAQVFPLDQRMWSEWPHDWDHRTFFSDEWPAWTKALAAGGKLTVEFYDQDAAPFATAEFDLPPLTAFNARATDDIRDFRARVNPDSCEGGSRTPLP